MAQLGLPLLPPQLLVAMFRLGLLWAGFVLALGSPNTSPNSAVMPSVSYLDLPFGWNRSSQDKDIAAVFNKVAYGSTTPPSVPVYNKTQSGSVPTTTTFPPPTPLSIVAVSSTTLPPVLPNTPFTLHSETPEYVSRTRFKPPLPPEYTNPFADKPILRGSQSESSAGGSGRRRPLPPPPRPPRPPPEQERIPIRPPDLIVPLDRNKKPLNTPARGTARPQQAVTYGQDAVVSRVEPRNDTEFDFVPILQNPAVTRILSGSSGRKEDDDRRNSSTRILLDHMNKDSMTAVQQPVVPSPPPEPQNNEEEHIDEEVEIHLEQGEEEEEEELEPPQEFPREEELEEEEEEESQIVTDPTPPMQESHWDSHVWGVAWDIHVYLMGSLFALLALISIINFLRTYKRLLPKGYFVSLNGLLLIIGVFRSIFLLYDAYNLHHSYPAVISPLLLNFVFPCLTSAFAILFLYLVQTAKLKLLNSHLQTPSVVAVVTMSHLLLCLSLDIVAGCLLKPHSKFLLLVCQALFLVWGVTLAVTYLFVFGALSRAALRQQCDFLRAPFSKLATLPPQNPTLGLAVRALLATAMLMLLLAAVQLYGIFGVYGIYTDEPPRPWPWWGFQFSVRVIEVSMCFLMVFVATLRHSDEDSNSPSVFTLFNCKNCSPQEENNKTTTEDIMYPAICSTNQAIHNYSMHTGKKVYDDSFPLSNMPLGDPIIPVPVRMSMKKSGTMLSSRSEGHHSPSSVHSQRPSSMLFAEDGFVRFRTSADPEQPMEEVLHQSMNRKGGTHEAVTAFNLPADEVCIEQTKVRYRPGMIEELKYDMRGMMSPPMPSAQQQRMQLLHQGEYRGGRQGNAMGGCGNIIPLEMWHNIAATTTTATISPLHGHLSPATPHHPHIHHHPSESSADSDIASNSDEDQDSPLPSSSQDITPDSAVGSDIYSKNGEGPVENNRYWCEDEQIFGLDLLSRSLINRLKGSNFSLNHLQGYTPLDSVCHPNNDFKRVLLGQVSDTGYYLNACKLEALYNIRPEDESAV